MTQHPTARELDQWRRGEVAEDEVLMIAQHLATCSECTSQSTQRLAVVADALCDEIEEMPSHSRRWPLAVAAALAIAVIGSLLWLRRPAPVVPVVQHTPVPSPRAALAKVSEIARSLQSERDVLRGAAETRNALAPAGVVIASARPEFVWPAPKGATSEVEVFCGDAEVVRSGALRASTWRPPSDLPRGVTYIWTVRVEHDGDVEILPKSPDPVARFHVIDETTLAELRRSNDPEAQRVLRELETW